MSDLSNSPTPEPLSVPRPSSAPLVVLLETAAATRQVGARLGRILEPGDILGLDGPLGAGKTCFMSGLARGLKVSGAVTSPTFTLVNQYAGRLPLFHADLYRLASEEELAELGLWELAEAGGVLAIEWLARFPDALPDDRLRLEFSILPVRGRRLTIRSGGVRSRARIEKLVETLRKKPVRGATFS